MQRARRPLTHNKTKETVALWAWAARDDQRGITAAQWRTGSQTRVGWRMPAEWPEEAMTAQGRAQWEQLHSLSHLVRPVENEC